MTSSIRSSLLRKFSTQTHPKIFADAQSIYEDESKTPNKSTKSTKSTNVAEWNSFITSDPDKFKLSEEELKQRRLSRKSLIINNNDTRNDQTITPKRHTICFVAESPKSVASHKTVDTQISDESSPSNHSIRRNRESCRLSLKSTITYSEVSCKKSEKFFKTLKKDDESSEKVKVLTESEKKQIVQIEQLRRIFEHTPAYMKKSLEKNLPIARPGTTTRSHLITYQ